MPQARFVLGFFLCFL